MAPRMSKLGTPLFGLMREWFALRFLSFDERISSMSIWLWILVMAGFVLAGGTSLFGS